MQLGASSGFPVLVVSVVPYSHVSMYAWLQFNSHVKRSEGSKIPKVELTISIDGVAIQDPKTKV
jgi:hypothetical protein